MHLTFCDFVAGSPFTPFFCADLAILVLDNGTLNVKGDLPLAQLYHCIVRELTLTLLEITMPSSF